MNTINQRLLEMRLRLECSGADAGVVSKVCTAIEVLDFSDLDSTALSAYFRCLDAADQMEWIKNGGSQFEPVVHREVLSMQEACFKLELVRRLDVEDELVDVAVFTKFGGEVVTEQRTKSAFDVAMSMKFGSDWDSQLKNPRGTQSSGTAKVVTDCLNEDGKRIVMSSSRQHGRTLVSLKPIEVAKHPSVEIDGLEVLVHEPLENSIECGIMLKECYEALKVISISMGAAECQAQESGSKNAGNGNMASGKQSREVFMVGLVEHVRHRQCRCSDGYINVAGEAHDLRGAWNETYSELLKYCTEADDFTVMEGWLADHPNPLQSYYAWKFPGKDSFKLAANAQAGVASHRLNKNGMAPRFFSPKLDAMRQQQNCERYIQWNLDDQIRKMLGGKRNNSVENLVGDNDVSDYYDEIYVDEDGNEWTYLEYARKMLAKSWVTSTKNANREIRKNAEKNMGKMYKSKSSKTRTGDKSTTVNGARCAVLTESTLYLDITINKDRVVPGFEAEFADGEFIGELEGNGRRNKIVSAAKLVNLFTALEFDWMTFATEELINGFAAGAKNLTKDDKDRMIKSYMVRLNDMSIESVYMDGDSPWLNIREHCFPEDVTVLARCINMDELTRLQKARQLVEDCGMDTNDMQQILTAYRKPVLFRKTFFEGEVRNQIWAGLK